MFEKRRQFLQLRQQKRQASINIQTSRLSSRIQNLSIKIGKLVKSDKKHLSLHQQRRTENNLFSNRTFISIHSQNKKEKQNISGFDGKDNKMRETKLDFLLKQNKQKLSYNLQRNLEQMKSTYNSLYQDQLKINQSKKKADKYESLKPIQSKLKTTLSRKTLRLTLKTIKNELNIFNSNIETNFNIKHDNYFKTNSLPLKCYDSIFPIVRSGQTIISTQQQLYIYGGLITNFKQPCQIHKFNRDKHIWQSVEQNGKIPLKTSSFHTADHFNNCLIFCGGIYLTLNRLTKSYNHDINIYNTYSQEWSKIQWNISLAHHASTIYGNNLVIYGGINQKNQYINKMHILPLDIYNVSLTQPNVYTIQYKGRQLARHKIINTYNINQYHKNKIQNDGILCFGGKRQNGSFNQDLLILRFHPEKRLSIMLGKKDWEIIKTYGKKPEPRFDHSMNILQSKHIMFVIGGINIKQNPINDCWIFDLAKNIWTEAIFNDNLNLLSKGIASHSATILDNEIFIFGGTNQQHKLTNNFFSVSFQKKRISKYSSLLYKQTQQFHK